MAHRPVATVLPLLALMALLPASLACDEGSSGKPGRAGEPGEGRKDAGPSGASAGPPAADDGAALGPLAREYRGTIGDAAVVVRLAHDGGRVTGTFFRETAGTTVVLAGASKGSTLTLDETVDKAKVGALTLELAPGGGLAGTQADGQAGGGSTPVHLEPVAVAPSPASALLFKRVAQSMVPVRGAASKEEACKANVTYAELLGLPTTLEAKLNADLAPAPEVALPPVCDHAVETGSEYRVAHNGDGLLSVRVTSFVSDAKAASAGRSGRVLNVVLATGAPVKLFGDVVKPGAERTFESALNQQIDALARKNNVDATGRKLLDQALAFSPPFVLEDKGVRLFPDALPPAHAALAAEGVLVRYATLPRPHGPAAVMWGK